MRTTWVTRWEARISNSKSETSTRIWFLRTKTIFTNSTFRLKCLRSVMMSYRLKSSYMIAYLLRSSRFMSFLGSSYDPWCTIGKESTLRLSKTLWCWVISSLSSWNSLGTEWLVSFRSYRIKDWIYCLILRTFSGRISLSHLTIVPSNIKISWKRLCKSSIMSMRLNKLLTITWIIRGGHFIWF